MRHVGVGSESGTLLVGVHQAGSDVTRLLPPSALFQMHPTVKEPCLSLEPTAATEQQSTPSRSDAAEEYARKRALVASLGSAKAVKKQMHANAAAVSADALYNANALTADLAGAAEAGVPEARTARELHPLHPPFDLEATTVAGTYPREGIIPPHVWTNLEYSLLRGAAGKEEERLRLGAQRALWHPFTLHALVRYLPTQKSLRHAHMRGVLYLAYMLRFYTLRHPIKPPKPTQRRGGEERHPDALSLQIPQAPWEQLLADFTEAYAAPAGGGSGANVGGAAGRPPKRWLTATCREKLVLHVLALALTLCEGELACEALATALELTAEKCSFYLRQLGCTVSRRRANAPGAGDAPGGRVASLRVPLEFPKLSRGVQQAR